MARTAGASDTMKFGRTLLILLLALVLLPIGGVLVHAVVPPPTTLLMVSQAVAGHGLDYRWRSLNHISPRLVEAVIASEDARFCSHDGFDFQAIEKAMDDNARGRRVRGGSTISQQTAKNVFLWPGRSWTLVRQECRCPDRARGRAAGRHPAQPPAVQGQRSRSLRPSPRLPGPGRDGHRAQRRPGRLRLALNGQA